MWLRSGKGIPLGMLYFCIGLFLAAWLSKTAAASEVPCTIRVGCLEYENFSHREEDGTVSGYMVEYLEELADYDSFVYTYTFAEDISQLKQMLKDQEIDLVCMRKNQELDYEYSTKQFVVTLTALYAREEDDDFYYDDYQRLDGARLGIVRSTQHKEYLEDYAKIKGFDYIECEFDTLEQACGALKAGRIDAVATDSLEPGDGVKCVGNFGMEVMYLASWNNNPLMKRINYAMNEISSQNIRYETNLFEKYFQTHEKLYHTNYTREESQWIKDCPALRVAFAADICPMSYTDEETGEVVGITPEILELISEKSGLHFEYFPLTGRFHEYSYDYFWEHSVDLLTGVEVNSFNEHKKQLRMSESYFSSTKVLVGRRGEKISADGNYKIAIVGGSATLPQVIADAFPNFEILTYSRLSDCLQAVKQGDANVLLYNQYLVEQYLGKPQYENLIMIPQIELPERVAISPVLYEGGLYEKEDLLKSDMLLKVLNKAIANITDKEINSIVIKHTVTRNYAISAEDLLYRFRYALFAVGILTGCIIFLLAGVVLIRNENLKKIEEKNRQLALAMNQANRANETKSRFLAQMSHEIRTPMNAIVGMTAMAEKVGENPARTNEYLEKIDLASKMLLNIINDILDMSAIENNKLKIAAVPFDIKKLLFSISTVYYGQCREKKITFHMVVSDLIDEIMIGDSLRINQILMNLISNAYKFTEPGGEINVNVTQQAGGEVNQIFLRFEVSDTGCGMSQDMLSRLFQAFEQQSADTAQKYGGSGLGLAITKNLVDLMHGAIQVSSKEGEGSDFIVTIPMVRAENIKRPDGTMLNNLRVLVVDDDIEVLKYTSDVLTNMNVAVETASSGEQAAELLTRDGKDAFDVCLIDWMMPGLSGVELTKELRKRALDKVMVIIVSAYDLSEIQEEAKRAGADLLIPKPLFPSTLFNALLSSKNFDGRDGKTEERAKEYDFTGKRALLVEDYELNREVALDLLGEVHLEADCAENGKEAVEMFEASKPGDYDVIFMDIQMPVMNGLEAAKAIRSSSHPQAASIPIFAMTANAFTEDISSAMAAGMNGHVAKPIDVDALFELLGRTLQ